MKKKFLCAVLLLCMLVTGGLVFTACGEQYIVERDYNLIYMQVIKDNTFISEEIGQYENGEITEYFTGNIRCDECIASVKSNEAKLIFDDKENSGFYASYNFSKYTNVEEYPAYKFASVDVEYNGDKVNIETFENNAKEYKDILQFLSIFESGNTSLQIVTQNKSFAAHFIILDENQELLFMSMIYGY